MRESERNDVFGAGGGECINGGLERRAGSDDVVDNDIGARGVGVVRGAEGAAHVLHTFSTGKRDLRDGFSRAKQKRRVNSNVEFFYCSFHNFLHLIKSAPFPTFFPERYWGEQYKVPPCIAHVIGVTEIFGECVSEKRKGMCTPVILRFMYRRADAWRREGKESNRFWVSVRYETRSNESEESISRDIS